MSELADKILTASLVIAFFGLLLVGCSPAITLKQVEDLHQAIRDERAACVPRQGFEGEIAALQSATENYFAAAKKALTR